MSPDSTQDLWPKWMWVAVPVLVVVVVAGLWWAIFGNDDEGAQLASATATATLRPIAGQPTQAPTLQPTLPALMPTATTSAATLPTVPSPTQAAVQTPTEAPTPTGGMAVGDRAQVTGANGVLNMRDGAGTGFKIVGSLKDGAIVEILDGPKEGNGYTWWQVRNDAGLTGWAAGDWLKKVD